MLHADIHWWYFSGKASELDTSEALRAQSGSYAQENNPCWQQTHPEILLIHGSENDCQVLSSDNCIRLDPPGLSPEVPHSRWKCCLLL